MIALIIPDNFNLQQLRSLPLILENSLYQTYDSNKLEREDRVREGFFPQTYAQFHTQKSIRVYPRPKKESLKCN